MVQFDDLFIHLPEYRVIICRRCKFAVIPTQIEGHIRTKHKRTITPGQTKVIVSEAGALEDVAHSISEVRYPNPHIAPIAWLPISQDGKRCSWNTKGTTCDYICCHRTGIHRHCESVHGWKNKQKRGRKSKKCPADVVPPPWVEGQYCQRFFKTGGWQHYFPIQAPLTVEEEAHSDTRTAKIQNGRALLTQLFQQWDAAKEEREVVAMKRSEANPWLEHTMWVKHIGHYKPWVIKMIQPTVERPKAGPNNEHESEDEGEDEGENEGERREETQESKERREAEEMRKRRAEEESEKALVEACEATIRLIRHSFNASRIEMVGRPAMEYIHRREVGAPNNDRPFYAKQKVATIRRYADKFVKILRYIWRTEHVAERPPYRLNVRQKDALHRYREMAARAARQKPEEPEEPSGTPPSGQGEKRRRRRQSVNIHMFVNVALAFWIAMFDHELGDSEFESGIISGLAVLGADSEDGGWMPAINYTPTLAAIITTMRAMVIRRAWQHRQRQIRTHMIGGMSEDAAQRAAPFVFDLVKADVNKFMTLTTFDGRPTPLNTVYTQKTYGMKIRYTTKAEGQITWEGDHI